MRTSVGNPCSSLDRHTCRSSLPARSSWASPPTAYGQDVVISEFLASNDTVLVDKDGDSSDIIEIHNRGAAVADLGGWYLTDDPAVLKKWRIPGPGEPATQLLATEFLLVFASAKNRAVADSELHANFRLSSNGEYLALVRPDGTVSHAYTPGYPRQLTDYSYGMSEALGGELRYFPTPTLGTPNADPGFAGVVEDTSFSVDRGFHDAPLDVEITTATPDADIYYTLDGSVPVPGESFLYEAPIHVSTTTLLRAAAFKADHVPTNVDTQTYLFLDDVLTQDGAGHVRGTQCTLFVDGPNTCGGL